MKEEWKDIIGYETSYQISNLGRVRSLDRLNSRGFKLKGKIMSLSIGKDGYARFSLRKEGKSKTFKPHRVVLEAFSPNKDNLEQVNHKNGIKDDNRLINLEWISRKDNVLHAYRTGLMDKSGSKNCKAKLTEDQVRTIRKSKRSTQNLAKIFNVNVSTIRRILVKETWINI